MLLVYSAVVVAVIAANVVTCLRLISHLVGCRANETCRMLPLLLPRLIPGPLIFG